MKVIARLAPVDDSDCRNVQIAVQSGGHISKADTYEAGTLYLRSHHVEPILRALGGHSFTHLDLEVRNGSELGLR